MKLETDLEKIKALSKKKEAENWGFRSFLKSCDISSKKIDLIAHRLYNKISGKIDCKSCGNCCMEMEPALTDDDIKRCSKGLKLSPGDFKDKYTMEMNEEGKHTFNQKPCPFLSETTCSIYKTQPADCHSYPHLHKKGVVTRLISMIHNCSICPIVYNVYEGLKKEIWSMGDDFDDIEELADIDEDFI
jgi:Fe-S-cluster containining protein